MKSISLKMKTNFTKMNRKGFRYFEANAFYTCHVRSRPVGMLKAGMGAVCERSYAGPLLEEFP
jgi:hypothetical protein